MNANWILKNGLQNIPFSSFPTAFRTAFNIVRKAGEAGQNISELTKSLNIQGPANIRGERKTYTYLAASELATKQDLLTSDGSLNSREFKNR